MRLMKKNILITGISGALGSKIARSLSHNYNIIGLDKSLEKISDYKVYLSDEINIRKLFEEIEIELIIHCATVYKGSSDDLMYCNIRLPLILIDYVVIGKAKGFINVDSFNSLTKDYQYLNSYNESKKIIRQSLKTIAHACKKIQLINMMIFHVYSEVDKTSKFINWIQSKLIKNETIELTKGENIRDFVHIDDVVSAFNIVIKKRHLLIDNFCEFQVGKGYGHTIKEVVLLMKKLSNSKSELKFGKLPNRLGEMNLVADNKTLNMLGWKINLSLENGLKTLF